MKRKILAVIMTLAMTAISMVGCGNNSDSVNKQKDNNDEKVKLQFTYFEDNEAAIKLYETMVNQFNEENDHIEVEFVPIIDDYQKKLLVMVASKTAPDVAWIGEDMIEEYASQGALLNLDDYDGKAFQSEDFIPSALEGYKYEGATYALPFDTCTLTMFMNNEIFKAAGIEVPAEPLTWDKLRELASKLTIVEDGVTTQYGFATGKSFTYMYPFIKMAGGDVIDNSGKTTFDSPEVREAFQFIHDLIHEDGSMKGVGDETISFYELYNSGKVAMMLDGAWSCSTALSQDSFTTTLAPLPMNKVQATPAFTGGAGVLSSTEHPEEAVEFLSWLAGEKGQTIKFNSGFAASPTIVKLQDTELAYKGYMTEKSQDADFSNLVEATNHAYVSPQKITGNSEIMDMINSTMDKYFLNEITLDELVSQLDEKVTSLLNE